MIAHTWYNVVPPYYFTYLLVHINELKIQHVISFSLSAVWNFNIANRTESCSWVEWQQMSAELEEKKRMTVQYKTTVTAMMKVQSVVNLLLLHSRQAKELPLSMIHRPPVIRLLATHSTIADTVVCLVSAQVTPDSEQKGVHMVDTAT